MTPPRRGHPRHRSGEPAGGAHLRPSAEAPRPVDLPQAVADALRPLAAARRLTVLVNDPQRHTASRAVLERLAPRIAPGQLRLLVATGTHHVPPAARRSFERDLCGDLPVAVAAWHDARGELVPIGPGAAWRGHPWLLDCDGVLAIGSVEPHYFAGYTGAHKTATVGCAAYEDVQANHAAALRDGCRPCRLRGNPVFEGVAGMLRALEACRPVGTVNLVQAGLSILAATGGEPLSALYQAVPAAEAAFVRRIDRPADALVVGVTGPLGRSFYQADKGIKNSERAVRDGGCIVLLAPCPEGIGQDRFVDLLRRAATYEAAAAEVARRGYRLGDHKAVRLRNLTDPARRGVRGFIVSDGLDAEQVRTLGMVKADAVSSALAAAGIDPQAHSVYHVHDAGNLVVIAGRFDSPAGRRYVR
jgi:nickel-dependent lactate racemase